MIVLLTFAGVLGARAVRIPTLTFRYAESVKGEVAHAAFTVRGLHCYGTADYLREHIESLPGLVSIVVYAGRRQVDIYYQSDETSPEQIISAFEVVSSDDE